MKRSPTIESVCLVIGDFGAAVRELAQKRPTIPRKSGPRAITGSMAPARPAPISTRSKPPLEELDDAQIQRALDSGGLSPTEASVIARKRRRPDESGPRGIIGQRVTSPLDDLDELSATVAAAELHRRTG